MKFFYKRRKNEDIEFQTARTVYARGTRTFGGPPHRGPGAGPSGGSGSGEAAAWYDGLPRSLKQFNVRVRTMREDVLESGHRVDYEVSSNLTISRPNKLHSKRLGHLVDQDFYYDGKTLTLYNATHKVYATVPAPGTIEETIDFARESLGIEQPVADLVYSNSFPLLMQDVTLAMVVDEEVIGGVDCSHLLFSRPGVDFQVWVANGVQPLPYKYIVTDTGTPALLAIISSMSDWNVAPAVTDSEFSFVPPPGATATTFMPIDTSSGTDQ